MNKEDYKLQKNLCMFSNELWCIALYKAVSLKNGSIYVLTYSEVNKPTKNREYKTLGKAFENFLKKVNI